MRIITLIEEHDVKVARALLDEESALLIHQSGHFDIRFPSPITNNDYIVRSRGLVGHVPLGPDLMLVIVPKIPVASLFGMLEVAYHLKSFQLLSGETSVSTLDELYDRVAAILARRVIDRARKGLYQSYLSHQESLTCVRGHVAIQKSLANWARGSVGVYCEYDELTYDLEDNQILLWTLYRTARAPLQRQSTLSSVRTAFRTLAGAVQLVEKAESDCIGRFYNPLNDDYGPLHGLCRLLLEHMGPDIDPGGQHKFVPFSLNMPNLFESFVAEWLKENVPHDWNVSTQYQAKLKGNSELTFRIDLILRDRATGTPIAVLDTKYKAGDDLLESDVQQIVAYAVETGVKRGYLVYPNNRAPVFLRIGDIEVRSLNFEISEPLEAAGTKFLSSLLSDVAAH